MMIAMTWVPLAFMLLVFSHGSYGSVVSQPCAKDAINEQSPHHQQSWEGREGPREGEGNHMVHRQDLVIGRRFVQVPEDLFFFDQANDKLINQGGKVDASSNNPFFFSSLKAASTPQTNKAEVNQAEQDAERPLSATLDLIKEAIGSTRGEWYGFRAKNEESCIADTVEQLEEAVASIKCRYIFLASGKRYMIREQMMVDTSKTIIGDPLVRASIDAQNAQRNFRVRRGASLDVRHILFYQGEGDTLIANVRTRFGGTIFMDPGSTLFAFDCLFAIQPEREAFFTRKPEFIFGGDILMTGGVANFVACTFFAIVPGHGNSISTEIGGSVLILAGTATFSGCNFLTTQLFAYNLGVGMHVAVLGGVLIMNGVTHTLNVLFCAQGLAGRNIFIGGGLGIFNAVAVTDTMAFLAFYGAGLSIFIGGGLGVFSGCEITLNNAISHKAGVGIALALGGGMALFYGTAFQKNLGITQFNILGLFVYVGAGRLALIGCALAHQNAISSAQALGGSLFLGAGQMVVIGCAISKEMGIDSFTGLGGDIFLGAGQLILFDTYLAAAAGIGCFIGQGIDVYVAAGSAVLKNAYFSVCHGLSYINENAVDFYVNGVDCTVIDEGMEEEREGEGEGERSLSYHEKGYGMCPEKEEGNKQQHLSMESITYSSRLDAWQTKEEKESATVYLGSDVTSCVVSCSQDDKGKHGAIELEGPSSDECTNTCDDDVYQARALSTEEAEIDISDESSNTFISQLGISTTDATDGQAAAAKIVPDTFAIVANVSLGCPDKESCSQASHILQRALEAVMLTKEEGLQATVVVTLCKSSEAYTTLLGIPVEASVWEEKDEKEKEDTSSLCPHQQVYNVYIHCKDADTYNQLKEAMKKDDEGDNINAAVLSEINNDDGIICSLDMALVSSYYVPSIVQKMATASSEDALVDLPYVWLQVPSPMVYVGSSYEILLKQFNQNDQVAIQLIPTSTPSSSSSTSKPLPIPLHIIPRFGLDEDAAASSSSWTWTVSPALFYQPGVSYYIKTFAISEPERFALSQAFVIVNTEEGDDSRSSSARAAGDGGKAASLLAALSSTSSFNAGSPGGQGRRTRGLQQAGDDRGINAKLLNYMLDASFSSFSSSKAAQKNASTTAAANVEMWKSLIALPSFQEQYWDIDAVKDMLAKTPILLQTSPELKALMNDEVKEEWKDPRKVQGAISKAMLSFIETSSKIFASSTSSSSQSNDDDTQEAARASWPDIIKDGMTEEDFALMAQAQMDGEKSTINELLNNQATKHFGVAYDDIISKDLILELKSKLMDNPVFEVLVNDEEIWKVLGMQQA